MTAKELGEQAAMPVAVAENTSEVSPGLTKRELFAAMAMQALLPNPAGRTLSHIAGNAISAADALLAELAKGQP